MSEAIRDRKDLLDLRDRQARPDRRAQRDPGDRWDPLDLRDRVVSLESEDRKDLRARRECKGRKDPRARQDSAELLVHRELKDPSGLRADRVTQESATCRL